MPDEENVNPRIIPASRALQGYLHVHGTPSGDREDETAAYAPPVDALGANPLEPPTKNPSPKPKPTDDTEAENGAQQ